MSVVTSRHSSSTPTSILKKTSTLKSRLNAVKNTPTRVRFILPQAGKVREILINYKDKINGREYENLVCLIRDSEFLSEDVSALIREATECISIMNHDLRLFVEALLSIKWLEQNDLVIREYQSFLINLISAHNYHADFIVDKLVRNFIPPDTDLEWPDRLPTSEDDERISRIHYLIEGLLKTVPMCKDLLLHSVINNFPYMKKSAHCHEYYIHNLLLITRYEPSFTSEILNLIASKLILMDVNAPREEIESFFYQEEDEEIFMMEDCSKSVISKSELVLSNFNSVAHNLDICLEQFFNYCITQCFDQDELNWERTKNLYHILLVVFDKLILPTYNTHHVQFIMFFLCSFKITITEAFLNYLWKKVVNPSVASVLRTTAVCYIVSLIARANFIPLTMIKATMQQMAEWIHTYIGFQDGLESINHDIRAHSVFYNVCQSLFYIVAFRHKDFIDSKKNITFLESLNLSKIVTSRLNPLRVCQPAVVQNFAAITRKYQLAYCYSIIEHNSRNQLPTIYKDEKGSVTVTESVIESIFPFDPYVLPRSGEKIYSYYHDYTEVDDFEKKEICDGPNDDFLQQEMSSSVKKFSYGTSPGFKFK